MQQQWSAREYLFLGTEAGTGDLPISIFVGRDQDTTVHVDEDQIFQHSAFHIGGFSQIVAHRATADAETASSHRAGGGTSPRPSSISAIAKNLSKSAQSIDPKICFHAAVYLADHATR